jgi:hypothetical protein
MTYAIQPIVSFVLFAPLRLCGEVFGMKFALAYQRARQPRMVAGALLAAGLAGRFAPQFGIPRRW